MSQIEIKNAEGQAAGTVELSSDVFGIEPNIPVIHQVVTVQLGNLRQGTHDTKGRSEVSGGGVKPWRQKGTGRARQGSIRATQWVGGGVPFGPTPRSHYRRLNNKEIKLALRQGSRQRARRRRQLRLRQAQHQAGRRDAQGPWPGRQARDPRRLRR